MNAQTTDSDRDPSIRKRRRILYAAAVVGSLLVAAVAASSLFKGDDKPKPAPKTVTPVIVARVPLKPVGGASGRGLAEILRRNSAESMRVLAAKLTPTTDKQFYQLVLSGGNAEERVLGNEQVGRQSVFIGESKISLAEIQKHKYIVLRRVTNGAPVKQTTILRGTIPE